MKRRTIKRKLREVIDNFANSITDIQLAKEVRFGCIVTGGAIANMLIDEPVNDYDIYFKTKELTIKVSEYFCKKAKDDKVANMLTVHSGLDEVQKILSSDMNFIKDTIKRLSELERGAEEDDIDFDTPLDEIGGLGEAPTSICGHKMSFRIISNIYDTFKADDSRVKIYNFGSWGTSSAEKIDSQEVEDEGEGKYEVKFISANAITLSDKIQLVIRFYGDADEIHKNFDFVHAMGTWDAEDGELYTSTEQLEALINRTLIYKGSLYPLASIFRSRKFIYRGWRIDAGQYLKMAFQLNDLDLLDPYTLEEQLTGVDLLYFYQIISDLKYRKMNDENFAPTTEYFIKIIEKVFE
jgi:hypothetical protein